MQAKTIEIEAKTDEIDSIMGEKLTKCDRGFAIEGDRCKQVQII